MSFTVRNMDIYIARGRDHIELDLDEDAYLIVDLIRSRSPQAKGLNRFIKETVSIPTKVLEIS